MRIAMLADSYYPTRDGVVTSISTIRRSLEDLGHEVYIIAPDPGKEKRVPDDHVIWIPAVNFRKYEGYYVPVSPFLKLAHLRRLKIDILHVHGIATMALRSLVTAYYLDIPTVLTFHTMVDDAAVRYLPLNIPEERMKKLVWLYIRKILGRMDSVIIPMEAIRKEITSHGVRDKKIVAIPTGIDTSNFKPGMDGTGFRKKYRLGEGKVIIHVGRMSFEKNIPLVIRAMQRIDATLALAGSGPERNDLEELAEELDLRDKVRFLGFVPDDELPCAYAAADAAVSASGFETQGLSILEAMASGLPVACCNKRAFADIIRDGENGFLFEDEEGCIESLKKCLDADDVLRAESIKTARGFDLKASAEKTIDLYEKAIKKKRDR